jgi:hypothetical protein
MGVSQKGRRRIVVDGQPYIWAVFEDLEAFGAVTLMVISLDKKFHARYAICQPSATRHLSFEGRISKRFLCPQFGSSNTISPSDVRELIVWCVAETAEAIEVDWTGRPVG